MDELEQLSIFDTPITIEDTQVAEDIHIEPMEVHMETVNKVEEEIIPYDIGDIVRVNVDNLDETDVLNYYYLIDFVKKRGMVKKVILMPSLQYEVEFGNSIAIMYHTSRGICKSDTFR